jgi:penicillin amidase
VRLRFVAIAGGVLVLTPLAVAYGLLRASLPSLDGTFSAAALSAPVTVQRDHLGVTTIEAANRVDLAYGTGFAHGQDRFFQMDLSRRLAAGELAELVGPKALQQDEAARIFRFRQVARQVLQQATPEQRAIMAAYARGVNDGLASLRGRPWEYWVLRSRPAPWLPEDSVLVVHAMWWQLQYLGIHREILRHEVNEHLGGERCGEQWRCALRFFYPARTEWDAPAMPGAASAAADIPPPAVLDVRAAGSAPKPAQVPAPAADVGSNNWAVAGSHTASGAALVANDMHLGQRVPVIWYRARLRVPGSGGQPGLDLTGVTLPGAPVLVAGSNGFIAWGFTNSYGKWLDVEPVACSEVSAGRMQTPSGPVALSVEWEQIRLHGAPSVRFPVLSGPGGLLLEAQPQRHQCWFGSWLAQLPEATNFNLIQLERVRSAREALDLAPSVGIPHQNFVVGDRAGHIGWAIYGRIPAGSGAGRSREVPAWTGVDAHPQLLDPPSGRLWTANARVTSDAQQELAIGGDTASLGAQYDLGARAQQIRDDLLALDRPATAADMLRIQLDDRAVFLRRWRALLLQVLDAHSLQGHPHRAELRRLVESWDAAAVPDSVGYRLVRTWHDQTERAVWSMLLGGLRIEADTGYQMPSQFESALWQLVSVQPLHLLAAGFHDWNEFLLAQVDASIAELRGECGELATCTWGRRNSIRIRHPLSAAIPLSSPLLDMPLTQLPGDHDMPRVQGETFGASERFAVSPGHEAEGYFHMPGGQSGHPLSPYYRAGFAEWARGEPLPFLPGPPEHSLTLQPEGPVVSER